MPKSSYMILIPDSQNSIRKDLCAMRKKGILANLRGKKINIPLINY